MPGGDNSRVYNVRFGVVDLNLRYVQFLSPSLPTCTLLSTTYFDGQFRISQCVCIWCHCYSKQFFLLGAFAKLRKAPFSFVVPVCSHGTTRLPLDGFLSKYNIWVVYETFVETEFIWNLTRMTVTLPDYVCTFLISRWSLLGTRSFADKGCTENQNTRFVFSNFFGPKIMPFVRMWENAVSPNRRQYCMAHAWKLRPHAHNI